VQSRTIERRISIANLAISAASLVAAAPSAVVSMLQLAGVALPISLAWLQRVSLPWLPSVVLLSTSLVVGRAIRSGAIWRLLAPVARFRLKAFGRRDRTRDALHAELVRDHIPLLRMSLLELVCETGLPIWEASFLMRHPDFKLRYDVMDRVWNALMVPGDWPRRESRNEYGRKCTKRRLLWYASKGECVWTASEIDAMSNEARATALSILEARIRRGLRETPDD
jgi:hypothetical protein